MSSTAKKIQIYADHGGSGLWSDGSLLEPEAVGLDPTLATLLKQWCESLEVIEETPGTFDWAGFNATGKALAARVAEALGAGYSVEYLEEKKDANDPGGAALARLLREPLPDDTHIQSLDLHLAPPCAGWTRLWLLANSWTLPARIALSDCFDPFPDICNWLKTVAEDALPSLVEINEEGHTCELVVRRTVGAPASADAVDVLVLGAKWEGEPLVGRRVRLFGARTTRWELVETFTNLLERWFRDHRTNPGWFSESGENSDAALYLAEIYTTLAAVRADLAAHHAKIQEQAQVRLKAEATPREEENRRVEELRAFKQQPAEQLYELFGWYKLAALAGHRAVELGSEYAREGRVEKMQTDGKVVTGLVRGTRDTPYAVRLSYKEESETKSFLEKRQIHDCDCPVGVEGRLCKHGVALAFVWCREKRLKQAGQAKQAGR